MAKFCGNCGSSMEDAAKVCGNCGTPFASPNEQIKSVPGVEAPVFNPELKKKIKSGAVVAAALAAVIIVVNIVSGFVGYKGLIKKAMKAYKNYDVNEMVSLASNFYYMDDDGDFVEDYFEDAMEYGLEVLEDSGRDYKFDYNIIEAYEATSFEIREMAEDFEYSDFDFGSVDKVVIAEIRIFPKGKPRQGVTQEFYLTKEDGKWCVLYIE